MGCVHCFIDHPGGEPCTLPVGPPCDSEALSGTGYGPLLLVRQLGAGALGTVYLAEHPSTGTHFAVKVLHPHLAENPAVLECFYAEARASRRISHPNVARTLDMRRAPSGHHCLLMEYVQGTPFSRLPLPLPPEEAVALLCQALQGLEAAHACGVIHRDIKPDNLVLTSGREGERCVKLLDFGMAAPLAAGFSEEELATGMVVGNPAYLAPELWVRAQPDGRADLYALAAVGYRLLTGRLPFGGGGRMAEMLQRRQEARPLPPHVVEEQVPQALSEVLMKALSLRPDERFASARALRAALTHALRRPQLRSPEAPGAPASCLRVRVEDPESPGPLCPVQVSELSEEGLFIAWEGKLPPLAARLQAELSFNGWAYACACDVVRLLPEAEARAWGSPPGFFLHFAQPFEEVRHLVSQALAEPPLDLELAHLLARAAACYQDPYALLALHPHADFAEVLQRASMAERRLESFRQRPLPSEQRRALEELRLRVEVARRTLGDPLARAGFDATRGNFRGVARCIASGVPPESLELVRRAFLSARPPAEARARSLFDDGILLEAQGALDSALARYAQALSVDPLNVSFHRYYHSLQQRLQASSREAPPTHLM
jgi:serine/threonine-protein kinase